jgi:hypothetical protein
MATNRIYPEGRYLELDISSFIKADSNSGTPVALNSLYGVIQYDAVSDVTVIDRKGVYDLPVTANDTSDSGSAISIGDPLYIDDGSGSLDAGELTPDDSNGTYFGIALEAVSSGDDDTIQVLLGY